MTAQPNPTAADVPAVSTERIRGAATGEQNVPVTPKQFDRWLAEHDAQVAAQALRDAAQDMRGVRVSDGPSWVENVLNNWADRIAAGA